MLLACYSIATIFLREGHVNIYDFRHLGERKIWKWILNCEQVREMAEAAVMHSGASERSRLDYCERGGRDVFCRGCHPGRCRAEDPNQSTVVSG